MPTYRYSHLSHLGVVLFINKFTLCEVLTQLLENSLPATARVDARDSELVQRLAHKAIRKILQHVMKSQTKINALQFFFPQNLMRTYNAYRRLSVVAPQLTAVLPWATRRPLLRYLFRAALAYPVPTANLLYGITEEEVASRTHVVLQVRTVVFK